MRLRLSTLCGSLYAIRPPAYEHTNHSHVSRANVAMLSLYHLEREDKIADDVAEVLMWLNFHFIVWNMK